MRWPLTEIGKPLLWTPNGAQQNLGGLIDTPALVQHRESPDYSLAMDYDWFRCGSLLTGRSAKRPRPITPEALAEQCTGEKAENDTRPYQQQCVARSDDHGKHCPHQKPQGSKRLMFNVVPVHLVSPSVTSYSQSPLVQPRQTPKKCWATLPTIPSKTWWQPLLTTLRGAN